MKKLMTVSSILAMIALPGSDAFGQRVIQGAGSSTVANGSSVIAIGSPVIGLNIAVPINISVLSFGNNQNNSVGQGNTGAIGIGATSSFVSSR